MLLYQNKVQGNSELHEFKELVMEKMDILNECGFGKPVARLKLQDKPDLIMAVTLHQAVLRSLAEMTQFREGLSALGVRQALEKRPQLFAPYYCCSAGNNSLTSGTVQCSI